MTDDTRPAAARRIITITTMAGDRVHSREHLLTRETLELVEAVLSGPRCIVVALDAYDTIDTIAAPGISPQVIHGTLREYLRRVAPTESITEFRLRRLAALRKEVAAAERRAHGIERCDGCRKVLRPEDKYATDDDGVVTCPECAAELVAACPGCDEQVDADEAVIHEDDALWHVACLADAETRGEDEPTLPMPTLRPEDIEAVGHSRAGRVPGPFTGEFGDATQPGLSANDTTDHPGDDPAF
jgi:hypothetical protein